MLCAHCPPGENGQDGPVAEAGAGMRYVLSLPDTGSARFLVMLNMVSVWGLQRVCTSEL